MALDSQAPVAPCALSSLNWAVATLYRRRGWIAASTLAFTVAFAAVAWLAAPVYRATTIMMPAAADRTGGGMASMFGQFGGIASLAGINLPSGDSGVEEALAVLTSRQFTESFIREKNLMPILFPKRWDTSTAAWRGPPEQWPTAAAAFKLFDRSVRTLLRDRKTGLIGVQITFADRNQAADWANDLVQRLNEEMRKRAIQNADAYLGYLERELAVTTSVATRDAVSRLIDVQVRQRMLAQVTQDYAFRVVDKAMAPDRDDQIRLPKLVIAVAGPIAGILAGSLGILIWSGLARRRARSAA